MEFGKQMLILRRALSFGFFWAYPSSSSSQPLHKIPTVHESKTRIASAQYFCAAPYVDRQCSYLLIASRGLGFLGSAPTSRYLGNVPPKKEILRRHLSKVLLPLEYAVSLSHGRMRERLQRKHQCYFFLGRRSVLQGTNIIMT